MDDDSIASMKSTAEALMKVPLRWKDPDPVTPAKDADMKETETVSTATPSTLSTHGFDVETMTQDDLEKSMQQAAEKLKNITPTKGGDDE
jgi:hypothetical protein